MSQRRRLPNRRANQSFSLLSQGQHYSCTVGWFADGTVAEVFLTNGKADSQSDSNARDAAVAASLAFQHGVSLDVLRHALLRDARGNPSTPLGAALDIIAKGEPT
jgi:hypothetical protein